MYVCWCEAEEESWLQCIQEQKGGLHHVFAQCEGKMCKKPDPAGLCRDWSI